MAACESPPQDINGQADDITCGLNKLRLLQQEDIDDESLTFNQSEEDSKGSLPDSPTMTRLNVNAQIFKPKQASQSSDEGDSQEGSGNGEVSPRSLDSSHYNNARRNASNMSTEEVVNRWRSEDRPEGNGGQYMGMHSADAWEDEIIRPIVNGDESLSFSSQRQAVEGGNARGVNQKARRDPKVADPLRVSRTIFVTDIDQMVTEEQLAKIFQSCGSVIDCRVCGDPNSALRFAVIEFASKEDAEKSLELNGITLGNYPIRVTKSRTAIIPVNSAMLPKDEIERELCSRTIYVANIDKSVSQVDVKLFFESLCGPVTKLRLLGDFEHPTRIAFVEFDEAKSATTALNCSGAILGKTPIRVSPSKTPVRPRSWNQDGRGRGRKAGHNRGDRRPNSGQFMDGQRHRGGHEGNGGGGFRDYGGRNGHSTGNGMGYSSHYHVRHHA